MNSTKSWGETNAPKQGERREIERLKFETNQNTIIRLVGDVLPRYVRWIVTNEGRKLPVECLSFNRETEMFDPINNKDPFDEIPSEIYGNGQNEKPQFAYVCNVINKTNKDKSVVNLFDLKKTIYSQIVDLAQNPDYGNPSDPKKGYNLTIKKEKTGPNPQNVKYTVTPGRNDAPLTDEEKEMELYDLNSIFKRQTYDEQKEWLLKNTNYFKHAEGSEFSPEEEGESAEDLV